MDTKAIYANVNSYEDWLTYKTDTSDGESSYLENKSVDIDLHKAQPSDIGDFKLRLAKEMSAFANTDSGIIAVGIGDNLAVVNRTSGLVDWLDKNIRDLIEPHLAGISIKECKDSNGNVFALMYVPKGRVMPYRVGSVKSCSKEKKSLREYFQRIGTNSVPIPMPIVRSLYLSNERSLDITVHVEPTQVTQHVDVGDFVELGIRVSPDQSRLINEYYLESSVILLDGDLKPLHRNPVDIVAFSSNSPNRPTIRPDDKSYILDTFRFAPKSKASNGIYPEIVLPSDGTEEIPPSIYSRIGGIYAETKFACDGLPLREDRRLLIFDRSVKTSELSTRAHEMPGWSSDCLVVSWFPITDESGLYYKILQFMDSMGYSTEPQTQ